MGKIRQLSDYIVSKIAAGEVIERPVFAVKELVENAIDANATSISIIIEESGLSKVVVTDNGEGMRKEDILESFKPHTTSKIEDELTNIRTLGFRGEALASIAAISNLTIQSRTKDQPGGFHVIIDRGELVKSGPIGMPPGTTITVSNLFAHVPARKKFLKSERVEFHAIVSLVSQYSLAYTNIRFLLIHNKKTIIDLPENQTIEIRVQKLLGERIFANFIPITYDESYLKLSGFIAHPQVVTHNSSKQFIFVNNRIVSSMSISQAIKQSFGKLLESTVYPVFVLSLEVPFEIVDVNIHPRKEQVAFLNHDIILEEIQKAVSQTLQSNNLTFRTKIFSSRAGSTDTLITNQLKNLVNPWSIKDTNEVLKSSEIQQIHNLYLLAQTNNGMVLIDQHAAHERILYEQFLLEFHTQFKKQKSIHLKKPIIISLSVADAALISDYIEEFHKFGFEIEEFSHNSYRVDSIPELLQDRNIENLIQEIFDTIKENKKLSIDRISQNMIAYLACRTAIKRGEKLEKDEAKRLIEKLQTIQNNYTCPHGRPTMIEITIGELDKMFKR